MRFILSTIKAIFIWFYKAIKETIAQLFTLLGFFYAWVTYTGYTKVVLGWTTIIVFVIWILTMFMREDE